jgi:hypothetical protein
MNRRTKQKIQNAVMVRKKDEDLSSGGTGGLGKEY